MKKISKWLILGLLLLLTWVLVEHDSFLYQQPVGLVTATKTLSSSEVTDEHGNVDHLHTQQVQIKFLNRSGQTKLENQYTDSQSLSEHYQVGNQVLLTKRSGAWQVVSLKRDSLLAVLLVLLIYLLIIYLRPVRASWLLLSMLVNIVIFITSLYLDVHIKNINVVALFTITAALLAGVSLLMVLGKNRQALITWLATILSTGLALGVMTLVLNLTHHEGVHFETMSYVTQVPAAVFYAQAVIGVLGAVMDESSDIVAGLFGLRRESDQHRFHDYWQGGLSVGREILGTLINVLFMIFIAETIPMVILMLRNNNNWSYILDQIMNLGILQSVVSAIGIVLAVPITSLITAQLLTREQKHERH
ncbi:YibE/F family protein [Convivina intestini]|uniref:YibE/F family protein n=1 Tax=Convivina intestini TaxID=1505726 RepID=UPI00200DF6EA|nr:YibE/F family protein [Convivina intestini]CAH1850776.1 hypothetical protein R078131_00159 [Convivina intestini]